MDRRKFSIESVRAVSVLLQTPSRYLHQQGLGHRIPPADRKVVRTLLAPLTFLRHPDGYLLGSTAIWMLVHKILRLKDRGCRGGCPISSVTTF